MSTITTALTISELIKLGFSLWMMVGKTSGMSEEELDALHREARREFNISNPEQLLKIFKEKQGS